MIPKLESIKHLFLHEWDPIGVSGIEMAEDEYDSYAMQVFVSLHSGATIASIADYLEWVVTERMEMSSNRDHSVAIATKVIALHADANGA